MATWKNTHLDRPQLSLCVSLIENGVNPEALAVGHGQDGLRLWLISLHIDCDQGFETRRGRPTESGNERCSLMRMDCIAGQMAFLNLDI